MKAGTFNISPSSPVMVIAEIGVNHDGSVARAIEIVEMAKTAGADAIKLQVFTAKELVNGLGILADYQTRTTDAESSADLLRKYELTPAEIRMVFSRARALGLLTIATPFSLPDVETLAGLGLDAIKIASPDVVNLPLLLAAGKIGLPLLVSTGAATIQEVDTARRVLATCGIDHLLMHCVSSYPVPDDQAHLCFISELIRRYGVDVGYSDHASSVLSGALAVAAGAVLIERHLTYDTAAAGPDHAASSGPQEFAQYTRLIREATALRGTGQKRVLPIESDVRHVSRQSLVLRASLGQGAVITDGDLMLQRPGTGIPASQWNTALGRKVRQDTPAGTLLTWDMLEAA